MAAVAVTFRARWHVAARFRSDSRTAGGPSRGWVPRSAPPAYPDPARSDTECGRCGRVVLRCSDRSIFTCRTRRRHGPNPHFSGSFRSGFKPSSRGKPIASQLRWGRPQAARIPILAALSGDARWPQLMKIDLQQHPDRSGWQVVAIEWALWTMPLSAKRPQQAK